MPATGRMEYPTAKAAQAATERDAPAPHERCEAVNVQGGLVGGGLTRERRCITRVGWRCLRRAARAVAGRRVCWQHAEMILRRATGIADDACVPNPPAATGRPRAPDRREAAVVRLTTYLRPDQAERLRREVLDRREAGQYADVSMLVREAVG